MMTMYQAAILYCKQDFNKILSQYADKPGIQTAFQRLAEEIDKQEDLDCIHWYAASTNCLQSQIQSKDKINPLDIFVFQAESLLAGSPPALKTTAYTLAIIGITLGVFATSLVLGMGLGIMVGLWSSSVGFLSALLAAEDIALVVTGVSTVLGGTACAFSSYLFFSSSPLEVAFHECVSKIKEQPLEVTTVAPA